MSAHMFVNNCTFVQMDKIVIARTKDKQVIMLTLVVVNQLVPDVVISALTL